MTEATYIGITNAIIALIGTMFTGIMAYLMAKLNQQGKIAFINAVMAAEKAKAAKEMFDASRVETSEKLLQAAKEVQKVKDALDVTRIKTSEKLDEAAEAANEIGIALTGNHGMTSKKLESMEATGVANHILANKNTEIQLKLNAELSQELADLTKDPRHIAKAAIAWETLKQHNKQQIIADEKEAE